jgi:peptidoglycan/xylan/chitin deacetylase (PgdA/CDA1 family)
LEGLFRRHVADLQTLAEIVERRGGKLTVQAQTPFTRKLAEAKHPLLRDFERRGHEVALHFHENAHLGPDCDALAAETWTAVMREEIDWLKKAGAARIRYWSGGNLYPRVIEAASRAGLDIMSDYKNPRTQRDDQRLLAVNPWRPAEGPREGDLAGFARHGAGGKIVYLPNGIFERVDHSAMRRSADLGGDYPYFDALTRGLELSLRAARPDRVNVFHITVHAGEFRGGPEAPRPFAVIEDWLDQVVAPLVKARKVRWATFSDMADAFKAWEKANPVVPPRAPGDRTEKAATSPPHAATARGYITFVVNTHDWGRVDKSANTVLRLIELFAKHKVRGDFYLTAPVVEAYSRFRPEVIARLRESRMTISYHFRPPHPAYPGFDAALRGLNDETLQARLRDYETFRLDLATGGLDRDRPGGYTYVKQALGAPPVVVSALSSPRAKAVLLDIYRDMGAQMTMEYHESGTQPDQPFVWRQGLLIRPSDFSITRWAAPGETREDFWWNRVGTPQFAHSDPTAQLERRLAAWSHSRAPLITALIHENDFYVRGGPSWNTVFFRPDGRTPREPPYDLNTPDPAELRTPENQAAIWRAYEELVAYAAKNLAVVTSAEILGMAKEVDAPVSGDTPARTRATVPASGAATR